ncbi:MAG: hypothetical protein V7L11_00425, partial [Nostoc sp.]|uniref:hypothetical protein n=1 Tax=Nostoc sp. TaxID=1180 RepID=UPI002FF78A1E
GCPFHPPFFSPHENYYYSHAESFLYFIFWKSLNALFSKCLAKTISPKNSFQVSHKAFFGVLSQYKGFELPTYLGFSRTNRTCPYPGLTPMSVTKIEIHHQNIQIWWWNKGHSGIGDWENSKI